MRRALLTAFVCLLIGSVALACGVKPPAGEPPPTAEVAVRGSAIFATPEPLQRATVVGSVDGHTLVLSLGGRQVTTRLLLIDTPQAGLGECFSGAAAAFVAAVLPPGSSVALERDQSELDALGRPLRYAYLPDGSMLNEQLVRGGFARVTPSPSDQKYLERLLEAEAQAKRDGLGLWSACETPTPAPAVAGPPPTATTTPEATAIAAVVAPPPTVTATPTPSPSPTRPPSTPSPATTTPTATPTASPTASPTATPTAEPTVLPPPTPAPTAVAPPPAQPADCDPAYPTVCIPPAPPDLDCGEIPHRRFEVLPPDPHRFDRDKDGIGCES